MGALGPSCLSLIDHRESPGRTITCSAARAPLLDPCKSFACDVSLALAIAGKTTRSTTHSANAAMGAYAYRLSLVNKVFPLYLEKCQDDTVKARQRAYLW